MADHPDAGKPVQIGGLTVGQLFAACENGDDVVAAQRALERTHDGRPNGDHAVPRAARGVDAGSRCGAHLEALDLRRPIYKKTAAYGHFGRSDPDFTWEATDKAAKLAVDAGLKREPVGARK